MDRYFNILPKKLLNFTSDSFDYTDLNELRENRWEIRDKLLEMSQCPYAASNGIGLDHYVNLIDLQDVILAKFLIKKLEEITPETLLQNQDIPLQPVKTRKEIQELSCFLQLLFNETPKLIEFLFSEPQISDPVLILLFEYCPALIGCTMFLNDSIHTICGKSVKYQLYYWFISSLLSLKYPSVVTLDLCKVVIAEIVSIDRFTTSNLKRIVQILHNMIRAFPFLSETISHRLLEWMGHYDDDQVEEDPDLQLRISNLIFLINDSNKKLNEPIHRNKFTIL